MEDMREVGAMEARLEVDEGLTAGMVVGSVAAIVRMATGVLRARGWAASTGLRLRRRRQPQELRWEQRRVDFLSTGSPRIVS